MVVDRGLFPSATCQVERVQEIWLHDPTNREALRRIAWEAQEGSTQDRNGRAPLPHLRVAVPEAAGTKRRGTMLGATENGPPSIAGSGSMGASPRTGTSWRPHYARSGRSRH